MCANRVLLTVFMPFFSSACQKKKDEWEGAQATALRQSRFEEVTPGRRRSTTRAVLRIKGEALDPDASRVTWRLAAVSCFAPCVRDCLQRRGVQHVNVNVCTRREHVKNNGGPPSLPPFPSQHVRSHLRQYQITPSTEHVNVDAVEKPSVGLLPRAVGPLLRVSICMPVGVFSKDCICTS